MEVDKFHTNLVLSFYNNTVLILYIQYMTIVQVGYITRFSLYIRDLHLVI